MTVPTETDPFPPEQTDEAPPPFDNQLTFELTKRINQVQLIDEIREATGQVVQLAVSGDADFNALADPSPDNVASLSVSPGTVDRAKVQKALDDHVPVDGYDVSKAEQDFAAVLAKVTADDEAELTDDEVKVAVRGLLRRSAAPPLDVRRGLGT